MEKTSAIREKIESTFRQQVQKDKNVKNAYLFYDTSYTSKALRFMLTKDIKPILKLEQDKTS